jgi:hypothetical protein
MAKKSLKKEEKTPKSNKKKESWKKIKIIL